jgi:hypothetical protein
MARLGAVLVVWRSQVRQMAKMAFVASAFWATTGGQPKWHQTGLAKMARLVAVGDTARLQYEWNLSKNGNSFRGCICTMTRLDKICFSFTLFLNAHQGGTSFGGLGIFWWPPITIQSVACLRICLLLKEK